MRVVQKEKCDTYYDAGGEKVNKLSFQLGGWGRVGRKIHGHPARELEGLNLYERRNSSRKAYDTFKMKQKTMCVRL